MAYLAFERSPVVPVSRKARNSRMKTTAIVIAGCVLVACCAILAAASPQALSSEEDLQETITYLAEYVRNSDVIFIRNNKEHTPEEAAEHIMKKYDHYKKKIETPEDFIRLSATKSMMSGKQYHIRTPDGVTMTSAEWLTRALEEYRKGKGSPEEAAPEETFSTGAVTTEPGTPGDAGAKPGPNPDCPDSCRYEIRSFERSWGDCDDARRVTQL